MKRYNRVVLVVLIVAFAGLAYIAGIWLGNQQGLQQGLREGQQVQPTDISKPGIHVIGPDRIFVSVMPPKELAGKYVVRPLCSNLNLRLECGEEQREITQIQHLGLGAGIGCPRPLEDSFLTTALYDDNYIDVLKLPEDPRDLELMTTECRVSELFNLTPEELGVPGNAEGKVVSCRITGAYDTSSIKSPVLRFEGGTPLLPEDKVYEWCLDTEGKVPLQEVRKSIQDVPVYFYFPGEPPAGVAYLVEPPWMFASISIRQEEELDWSRATLKPVPYGPTTGPDGTDDDGFEDPSEKGGFAFSNGLALTGSNYPNIPANYMTFCASKIDTYRDYCIHYDDQELFAILEPLSSNSSFPNLDSPTLLREFFWKIPAPRDSTNGGLDIVVHPVTQAGGNTSRLVNSTDNQMAIRIRELDDGLDSGSIFGYSKVGVPVNAGEIDIYTVRIRQYLCDMCGGDYDEWGNCTNSKYWDTDKCRSVTPVVAQGEGLVKEWVRWVLHHEMGHSLNLTADLIHGTDHAPYIATQIMTDEPYRVKHGSKVDWYLPSAYCSLCRNIRDLTYD